MFFNIFSQKTNIHSFNNFFYRYHLFNIAVGAVLRIGFSFETNSMEQSIAMRAFEGTFILSYNFSLVETNTLRLVLQVIAYLCLFILRQSIRLLIFRAFYNLKIKSLLSLILNRILYCS
jgi:hypothetical protein